MDADKNVNKPLLKALEDEMNRVGGAYLVYGNNHMVNGTHNVDVYVTNDVPDETVLGLIESLKFHLAHRKSHHQK